MRKPFDINYKDKIQNGELSVQTRLGAPAKIIEWNASPVCPVVALVNGVAHQYKKNGWHADVETCKGGQCLDMGDYDLYVVCENPKWTSFEKQLYDLLQVPLASNPTLSDWERDEMAAMYVETYGSELLKSASETQDSIGVDIVGTPFAEYNNLTEFEKELVDTLTSDKSWDALASAINIVKGGLAEKLRKLVHLEDMGQNKKTCHD